MPKKILILEDDDNQLQRLEKIVCDEYPELEIFLASSYNDAVKILKRTGNFAFFMLDIDLGNDPAMKDGLDFARYIRSMPEYEFVPIIYISSVSERALEAYKSTHCYEFIDKPYSDKDVVIAINKMLSMPEAAPEMLNIKGVNGSRLYLAMKDIIYIEAVKHDLYINTTDSKYLSKSGGMKNIINMLPSNFIQCHRSFIVNTYFSMSYSLFDNTLSIKGIPTKIPVSRKYKDKFKKLFE